MWTLLLNESDWRGYQERTAAQLEVPVAVISWGHGPKEYPCLISSTRLGPGTLRSAYVYATDARMLVDALTAPAKEPLPVAPSTVRDERREFDISVSANILAIVHQLVSVGVCSQAQYETSLASFRALVDQDHAQRMDLMQQPTRGLPEGT